MLYLLSLSGFLFHNEWAILFPSSLPWPLVVCFSNSYVALRASYGERERVRGDALSLSLGRPSFITQPRSKPYFSFTVDWIGPCPNVSFFNLTHQPNIKKQQQRESEKHTNGSVQGPNTQKKNFVRDWIEHPSLLSLLSSLCYPSCTSVYFDEWMPLGLVLIAYGSSFLLGLSNVAQWGIGWTQVFSGDCGRAIPSSPRNSQLASLAVLVLDSTEGGCTWVIWLRQSTLSEEGKKKGRVTERENESEWARKNEYRKDGWRWA